MITFDDYLVFADESGDHGLSSIDPSYPVFVLVFCLIKKIDYMEQIAPKIMEFKFKYFGHDQVILHEHEIRKAKPPFNILQEREVRNNFHADLSHLIEVLPFKLVASVIKKRELVDRYQKPNNPYHIAMEFCLERIYRELEEEGCKQQGMTHVIFEARGRKEDDEVELEFRRLCDENRFKQHLPFNIIISDKKTNTAGLQLADLIARPIGRKILQPKQDNRAYDILKSKFRTNQKGEIDGWGLKCFP